MQKYMCQCLFTHTHTNTNTNNTHAHTHARLNVFVVGLSVSALVKAKYSLRRQTFYDEFCLLCQPSVFIHMCMNVVVVDLDFSTLVAECSGWLTKRNTEVL